MTLYYDRDATRYSCRLPITGARPSWQRPIPANQAMQRSGMAFRFFLKSRSLAPFPPDDRQRYFAHDIMALSLNGFYVHPELESLMFRDDWAGKRTHENWLKRFPGHPESPGIQIVEFCSPDWAIRENQGIQHHRFLGLFGLGRRDDMHLIGKPDVTNPPGDFDPWHGYLIGFTDYCDAGIFIDLRPDKPRVIYDTLNPISGTHSTAFDTIGEFIDYCEQHLHEIERKITMR